MKRSLFMYLAFLVFTTTIHAQQPAHTDSTHAMVMPDSNTVYLDENRQPITGQAFSERVESGHYTYKPTVEDGKLKSMQLAKVDGNFQLGQLAPDFTVNDLNGKTWSRKELLGKTVVLNCWFTTCMPCRQEMPDLNQLREKYQSDTNVVFLSLCMNDEGTIRTFLAKTPFTYAIAPEQMPRLQQFGITSFPTNAIIDPAGKVSFLLVGYHPDNLKKLDAAIQGAVHS